MHGDPLETPIYLIGLALFGCAPNSCLLVQGGYAAAVRNKTLVAG